MALSGPFVTARRPVSPHPPPHCSGTPMENRLEEAGYGVGHRVLELLSFREKQYKRETKLIGILQVRLMHGSVANLLRVHGSAGWEAELTAPHTHVSPVRLLDRVEGALQQGGRLAGAQHRERGRMYVFSRVCSHVCSDARMLARPTAPPTPSTHRRLSRVHCPHADMIHEREPITNTFVSAPADMGQLNCAAYVAGIISGILNGASFVRRASVSPLLACLLACISSTHVMSLYRALSKTTDDTYTYSPLA